LADSKIDEIAGSITLRANRGAVQNSSHVIGSVDNSPFLTKATATSMNYKEQLFHNDNNIVFSRNDLLMALLFTLSHE
jgi:hypothetical protein